MNTFHISSSDRWYSFDIKNLIVEANTKEQAIKIANKYYKDIEKITYQKHEAQYCKEMMKESEMKLYFDLINKFEDIIISKQTYHQYLCRAVLRDTMVRNGVWYHHWTYYDYKSKPYSWLNFIKKNKNLWIRNVKFRNICKDLCDDVLIDRHTIEETIDIYYYTYEWLKMFFIYNWWRIWAKQAFAFTNWKIIVKSNIHNAHHRKDKYGDHHDDYLAYILVSDKDYYTSNKDIISSYEADDIYKLNF